jgi:glycosyltransferase involved in cell wall biosynthesis
LIIVDASNIAVGGGKVLLIYLINALEKYGVKASIIWKKELFQSMENQYQNIRFVDGSRVFNRKRILQEQIQASSPTAVLCFGNYPPPMKVQCPVFTYFHNPYLLDPPLAHFKTDPLLFIRDRYLKLYLKNADFFIFQSTLIKDKFLKKFTTYNPAKCLILPIFDEEKIKSYRHSGGREDRFIYVSYPYKHKNHATLLKAWDVLLNLKLTPTLVVTIPEAKENQMFLQQIQNINDRGGQIINLHSIPYEQALMETSHSRYVLFPSINETFGLGLIEGALLDCTILASDLNFVHEVVKPAYLFDPFDSQSIADSVLYCLHNPSMHKAEVLAKNTIGTLVHLLDGEG